LALEVYKQVVFVGGGGGQEAAAEGGGLGDRLQDRHQGVGRLEAVVPPHLIVPAAGAEPLRRGPQQPAQQARQPPQGGGFGQRPAGLEPPVEVRQRHLAGVVNAQQVAGVVARRLFDQGRVLREAAVQVRRFGDERNLAVPVEQEGVPVRRLRRQ